eukprot:TRINITY_DN103998_c0_g2_i1.p2 TRINITY_DN103998_c0_g2~~TRINITY_DN103998_c0_g2_i1.p2  ORF type:complete len:413 (+),score=106.44 TRINITY_DN103998_c0_g2_i1:2401-3639(+)
MSKLLEHLEEDPEEMRGRDPWGEDAPPQPSLFTHLIKQLRPKQDLTRVLIPVYFLESRSLLEKFTDLMMHPDFLTGVNEDEDPMNRMIQLCKWYLSGYHFKVKGVKKPFNPVIGETFAAKWDVDGTEGHYFAEQVCHRPPISAIYFENRKQGVSLNAQVWTKSQFLGNSAASKMKGGAFLHLTNRKEMYYCTFPTYYANGLFVGKLRTEMGGESEIVCHETGLKAKFDWKQKGVFGGSYNVIKGHIKKIGTKKRLFEINGKWDEGFTIKNIATGEVKDLFDLAKCPIIPKKVLSIEKQGEWESQRLWKNVADNVRKDPPNWTDVEKHKTILEEAQRLVPCHLSENGQADSNGAHPLWKPKMFDLKEVEDPMKPGTMIKRWFFKDMNTDEYVEGEEPREFISLSANLVDSRSE